MIFPWAKTFSPLISTNLTFFLFQFVWWRFFQRKLWKWSQEWNNVYDFIKLFNKKTFYTERIISNIFPSVCPFLCQLASNTRVKMSFFSCCENSLNQWAVYYYIGPSVCQSCNKRRINICDFIISHHWTAALQPFLSVCLSMFYLCFAYICCI